MNIPRHRHLRLAVLSGPLAPVALVAPLVTHLVAGHLPPHPPDLALPHPVDSPIGIANAAFSWSLSMLPTVELPSTHTLLAQLLPLTSRHAFPFPGLQ